MEEDEDIYDVAPGDQDKVVSFRALKETWNKQASIITPKSPPPTVVKPRPEENIENGSPKPFLPQKKGPQISLGSVQSARNQLNLVPEKRASAARNSKVSIPAAFQTAPASSQAAPASSVNIHNKPMPTPKPVMPKKPAQNGSVPKSELPPSLPSKAAPPQKPEQRKTLMPPPSPPQERQPPATSKTTEHSVVSKQNSSSEPVNSNTPEKKPEDLSQNVTSADGKTYKLLALPKVRGVGPIKPTRPPNVNIAGCYDDDELYDEVGIMPDDSARRPRSSVRPISEYTEEDEEKFEQKPGGPRVVSSRVSARVSTLSDEDLYDTVEDLKLEEQDDGEIYDDDLVMNPKRESTASSVEKVAEPGLPPPRLSQKMADSSSAKRKSEQVPTRPQVPEPDLELYDDVAEPIRHSTAM